MTILSRISAAAMAVLLLAQPALAQTPPPGNIGSYRNAAGLVVSNAGVRIIGKDSVTGLSCYGGETNCNTGAGSGGGSLTGTVNVAPLSGLSDLGSQGFSFTGSGAARVTFNDPNSGGDISFNDKRTIDASLLTTSLNTHIDIPLDGGLSTAGIAVTGLTASGATLTFQVSSNPTAASPQYANANILTSAGTIIASNVTADGNYTIRIAGKAMLRVNVTQTGTGTVKVSTSLSAGMNHLALDSPLPPGTADLGQVHDLPSNGNGEAGYHVIAAASDNHAVIKTTSGQVYEVDVTNQGVAWEYVRLYNATTGFNGCNSATNLLWGQAVPPGGGYIKQWKYGRPFGTGLSICITGATSDTDTTNSNTTTTVNVAYF